MPTVRDVVRRLFPRGTNPTGRRNWGQVPRWPPDAFALAASLIELSGCYVRPRFAGYGKGSLLARRGFLNGLQKIGERWSKGKVPREVDSLWRELANSDAEVQSDADASAPAWSEAAFRLLIIADSASVNMGFVDHGKRPLSHFVFVEHVRYMNRQRTVLPHLPASLRERPVLPHLPASLCLMVPPTEVCVQPKTRTAQVGHTLRSLSHHLALLPSKGLVATSWLFALHLTGQDEMAGDRPLNLLLVPFPYRVDGACFDSGDACTSRDQECTDRFFRVRQKWLDNVASDAMRRFLEELIGQACRQVSGVHGVILPELALDRQLASDVAEELARTTDLELFISGAAAPAPSGGPGFPKNIVFSRIFMNHSVLFPWEQSKHHRWVLNRSQITRYQLGDRLNVGKRAGTDTNWREEIDISDRQCGFLVFRHGASLVTLVCEDLARIDPVQSVIRSVGPNLVVALLMDGPQLQKRWSSRYATVLADDPGCAVLTLTSLAFVRRSVMPGEQEPREIALWKEPSDTEARELRLPHSAHALLLTLSPSREKNFTLDGRSDNWGTVRMSLTGVHGIAHPSPPRWID